MEEEVKANTVNTMPDKETRKKQNEKELKDIMDAGAALAIKSKEDPAFNKIIKEKSGY